MVMPSVDINQLHEMLKASNVLRLKNQLREEWRGCVSEIRLGPCDRHSH